MGKRVKVRAAGETINHKMFSARALHGKHNKGIFVSIRRPLAVDPSPPVSVPLALVYIVVAVVIAVMIALLLYPKTLRVVRGRTRGIIVYNILLLYYYYYYIVI